MATYTWTGSGDGKNWSDPDNWYNQDTSQPATSAPGASDTVQLASTTLADSGTANIVYDSGGTTIQNGASLTVKNQDLGFQEYGFLSVSGKLDAPKLYVGPNGILDITKTGIVDVAGGTNNIPANGQVGIDLWGSGSVTGGKINSNNGWIGIGQRSSAYFTASDGATVNASYTSLGAFPGGSGSLTITGAGTTWTDIGPLGGLGGSGSMLVGGGGFDGAYSTGGDGFLTVSAGASLTETVDLGIAYSVSSTGVVTITDKGTTVDVGRSMIVGLQGSGTATIENGASVEVGTSASASSAVLFVGYNSGSNGYLYVRGSGTMLDASHGQTDIGVSGDGSMTVSDGASVLTGDASGSTSSGLVLGFAGGSNGNLTVEGKGTSLTNTGQFVIGDVGDGSFYLQDGATLDTSMDRSFGAYGARMAINASSTSYALITGEGTKWTVSSGLEVAESGAAILDIKNGGKVDVDQDSADYQGAVAVGFFSGSSGTINIEGEGSELIANRGPFYIGVGGIGSVTVTDSGKLLSGDGTGATSVGLSIGTTATGTGTLSVSGKGSSVENTGTLNVGDAGYGYLYITDGATFDTTPPAGWAAADIGAQATGTGYVSIAGAGSTLSLNGDFFVIGDAGSGDVIFTEGGTLDAKNVTQLVLGLQQSGTGTLSLDGAESKLDFDGLMTVGRAGTGFFSLFNGATYTTGAAGLILGEQADAFGALFLDGDGTKLTVDGTLTLGLSGEGDLYLQNKATLIVTDDYVAGDQAGGNGTSTITDEGTSLTVDGDMIIGRAGSHQDTVSNGASVTVNGLVTLGEAQTGNGKLTVTGEGSSFETSYMTIGGEGTGEVDVADGATLGVFNSTTLGESEGSDGTLNIDGEGSQLDTADLIVGADGKGTLGLSNGGAVNALSLTLGEGPSGNGTATIEDADSTLVVSDALIVGNEGMGQLTVNGTASIGTTATIGAEAGASGTIIVNAEGSLTIDGDTTIGESGSGAVIVQLGGTLDAQKVTLGENLGSIGLLSVDGADSTATTDDLIIGSSGAGLLNVSNEGKLTTKGDATFGEYVSSSVQTGDIASDGYWGIAGNLTVGGAGIATVTVESGGNIAVAGDVTLGEQSSATGTLDIKGTNADGSVPSGLGFGGKLVVGEGGTGTLNITDGALVAPTPGGEGTIEIAVQTGSTGAVSVDGKGSQLQGTDLVIGGTSEASGGQGTLSVSNDGLASVSHIRVWDHGAINLAGGAITGDIDLFAGGSVMGYGTITGTFSNYGTVTASGGTLTLIGLVDGSGSLNIDDSSTLDVFGVGSGIAVSFGSSTTNEMLIIGSRADFSATISNYLAGDIINIDDIDFAASESANLLSGNVLQIVFDGGTYDIQLNPDEDYSGDYFHIAAAADGTGIDITQDSVACYGIGTLIETAAGETAVERLSIGDLVRTRSGALRPIKWIGRRSYAGRFIAMNRDVLPVVFKTGSLGNALPRRDLCVSPHHAMYIDGLLIEAKDLVNGESIVQARGVERVDYFHIELDSHDVIIAEGAFSETFIDDDSRAMFHNAPDYRALYPNEVPVEPLYCAPRVHEGEALEAIRQRLNASVEKDVFEQELQELLMVRKRALC